MTRINCIPVSELCDQQLLGEWTEIGHVFTKARPPKPGERFPDQYTLGRGHVKFFYTRLPWLLRRSIQVYEELLFRGVHVDISIHNARCRTVAEKRSIIPYKLWTPTQADIELNRARVLERMDTMKRQPTYFGEPLHRQEQSNAE